MVESYDAWRAVDGVGDHPTNGAWGAVGAAEVRLMEADPLAPGYMDNGDRPSARAISNALSAQTEDTETAAGYSDFIWAWGQFIDHDLDLTGEGEEAAPIQVPTGDTDFDPESTGDATIGFHRSKYEDTDSGRAYANEITSYMDASNVYGSSAEQAAAIRDVGGKMLLDADGLLPKDAGGQYMGGDVRSGENIGLTSLHTIFAREHNRIVDELADRDPTLTDDELFTLARRVVEGEIQKITYNDYLPKILGEDALGDYEGFDADVDPTISLEFSTAAYRFGHTLLSPTLQRLAENGADSAEALALRDSFFNPTIIAESGVDGILRGLADGTAQAFDPMLVDDVRSFLFGQPGAGGFDLASLNIQRGRDHGMQSYNDMRESLGLTRKESFADITSDPDIAARLEEAYGHVDKIDAWSGGLAEDSYNGGLVGELFNIIITEQFERTRAGDPFWSEANPLPAVAEGIGLHSLGDIIVANTDVETMQADIFLAYDRQGGDDGDNRIVGGEGRDLLIGNGGDDRLFGRDDDDQLNGGAGDDYLNGGAGDDILIGRAGDDRLRGNHGDDEAFGEGGDDSLAGGSGDDWLEGGAGHDRLYGQNGDDALIGGGGEDRLFGGSGHDELFGGAGDDLLDGGAGYDALHGGAGDDIIRGGANDDALYGDKGADRLYGQNGDDTLFGGAGGDRLHGGAGDDRLEGGAGDDILRGDHGADVFVFSGDFGTDIVLGFSSHDVLEFHGVTLQDLTFNDAANVIISVGDLGQVTLTGVSADDLDNDALLFI